MRLVFLVTIREGVHFHPDRYTMASTFRLDIITWTDDGKPRPRFSFRPAGRRLVFAQLGHALPTIEEKDVRVGVRCSDFVS